jgi:hypothetical protein
MTMYLPNPAHQPLGDEGAEFIAPPPTHERPDPAPRPLDLQTRLDITRWAEEYISGLVDNHNGTPEDVRWVIHDLHTQAHGPEHDPGVEHDPST